MTVIDGRSVVRAAGTALKETAVATPGRVRAAGEKVANTLRIPEGFIPGTLKKVDQNVIDALPPGEALAAARNAGSDAVAINRNLITPTYERLAYKFQKFVDPSFDPANPLASRVLSTWFAIGAHPSAAAGSAIEIAGHLARKEELGAVDAILRGLEYVNGKSAANPLVAAACYQRLEKLLMDAPGKTLSEKANCLFKTMHNLFAEGNQRIFEDIGVTGDAYLKFREAHGDPSPAQVLEKFHVEGSTPDGAKKIYDNAMNLAAEVPQSREINRLVPPGSGPDSVVAGMAMYEAAREAPTVAAKNQLIDMANAIFSIREQRDLVDPVMNQSRPDEVDRRALMQLLTPTLKISAGGKDWTFAEYAGDSLKHADNNMFTPLSTEYNWADLETRMSGIWSFYNQVHKPEEMSKVWDFPKVKPELWEEKPSFWSSMKDKLLAPLQQL